MPPRVSTTVSSKSAAASTSNGKKASKHVAEDAESDAVADEEDAAETTKPAKSSKTTTVAKPTKPAPGKAKQAEAEAEDADGDADGDADDADDSSASASNGKKLAAKKITAPAKAKKPTNPESAAKRVAEQKRYENALDEVLERGLVTVFPNLIAHSVPERLATAINLHALETLSHIQSNEVRADGDYNPFPSDKFRLFEEVSGPAARSRVAVKSNGPAESKKQAPIPRGRRSKPTEEPVEEQTEDAVLDDSAEAEETTDEAKTETKTEAKRNVTNFDRSSKQYMCFMLMRFVEDLYEAQGGKNIKNNEDFTNFVYAQVSRESESHVSRSIVTTVNRLSSLVVDLPDRGVPKYLSELLESIPGRKGTKESPAIANFQDRSNVIKHAVEYFSNYLKLLGYMLATQLWVSRKTVNNSVVEGLVRILDAGNIEAISSIVPEGSPDYGLSRGFYRDAHVFINLVLPKPAKKEPAKKPTAKGRGRKPAKKDDEAEDAGDGEDAEAEIEVEMDDDADDADADGDADGDGDADDGEAEAEEEAPKKNLKKITKK